MSGRYLDERTIYERRDRETPQTRFWNSERVQRARFDAIVRATGLGPHRILDVGCGNGELLAHLVAGDAQPPSYLGVDVVPKFVAEARARGLPGEFVAGDFLDLALEARFDWAVANGLFGHEQPGALWWDRYRRATDRMWSLSGVGVAVTLISARSPRRNPEAHYCEPGEILADAQARFGAFVLIDHSYLPNDVLLVARREPR